MSWHTEYHRAGCVALEDRQPYLTSLLQTSDTNRHLARSRARNWLTARAEEVHRPDLTTALPYHVVLDPATVCNLRCPLCVQATDPHGRRRCLVDVDQYRTLIEEITPHVVRLDLFNWGEPLLHPQFTDIVRIADEASIWTRTSSNFNVSDFEAERIIEAGLRHVVVSIDGSTQAGYEKYRVRGDLELVLRNVAELVRARERLGVTWPVIEWQFLVLRHNVAEIDEARSRAADLGVDVFRYGGARGRMATKLRISTPANFAESAALLVSPDHELSEYDADGEKLRTAERDGCRWLWGKAVLNPDGGVAPCVSSWSATDDLGSWSGVHDSLGATWRSPAFQQARVLARTGGDPSGTTVCAQCAHHRNFVPTPDNDRESVTVGHGLAELAARLRENGRPVSPAVLATVTDELISTR